MRDRLCFSNLSFALTGGLGSEAGKRSVWTDGDLGRGWKERLPCFGKEHHLLAVSETPFPQAAGLNSTSTRDAHQAGQTGGEPCPEGSAGCSSSRLGAAFLCTQACALSPGCLAWLAQRPLPSALCCSAQNQFPGSHLLRLHHQNICPQPPRLFLLPTPRVRGFLSHICAPGTWCNAHGAPVTGQLLPGWQSLEERATAQLLSSSTRPTKPVWGTLCAFRGTAGVPNR